MSTAITSVRERPILFSGPMVRAILDGRKTQTRRGLTVPRWAEPGSLELDGAGQPHVIARASGCLAPIPYRYGRAGDQLWVRETFSLNHSIHYAHSNSRGITGMLYRASWDGDVDVYGRAFEGERRWRPSIHMPRWTSRITLELTDVRVEQLQVISGNDCRAEGIEPREFHMFGLDSTGRATLRRTMYRELWDSLNASRGFGWDVNPWVWVLSFRRVEGGAS